MTDFFHNTIKQKGKIIASLAVNSGCSTPLILRGLIFLPKLNKVYWKYIWSPEEKETIQRR